MIYSLKIAHLVLNILTKNVTHLLIKDKGRVQVDLLRLVEFGRSSN